VGVRPPGAWGRRAPANPANEVTTGSEAGPVEQTATPNPENLSSKGKAKAKSAKPANTVTTGFGVELAAENSKQRSVCERFREAIELGLSRGRDATAIWQDLVSETGSSGGYQTVKRYVRKLRGKQPLQPRAVILTGPGEECQVDYGTGPMVLAGAEGFLCDDSDTSVNILSFVIYIETQAAKLFLYLQHFELVPGYQRLQVFA
jgi:hypothetical protein